MLSCTGSPVWRVGRSAPRGRHGGGHCGAGLPTLEQRSNPPGRGVVCPTAVTKDPSLWAAGAAGAGAGSAASARLGSVLAAGSDAIGADRSIRGAPAGPALSVG